MRRVTIEGAKLMSQNENSKKNPMLKKALAAIGAFATIITIFLFAYRDIPEIISDNSEIEVPVVEDLDYKSARAILHESGFEVYAVGTSRIITDSGIVIDQIPRGGASAKKGSVIRLVLDSESPASNSNYLHTNGNDNTASAQESETPATTAPNSGNAQTTPTENGTGNTETPPTASDNTTTPPAITPQPTPNPTPTDIPSTQALSIIVDYYEIFSNGYLYVAPAPDNWFIDFDAGISGTFHYSRPLTPQELGNWRHGGTLYDANMNEIAEEGNYPSFWSDPNGYYAMQFPRNLGSGTYIYRIHQVINDVFIYTDIVFEYTR